MEHALPPRRRRGGPRPPPGASGSAGSGLEHLSVTPARTPGIAPEVPPRRRRRAPSSARRRAGRRRSGCSRAGCRGGVLGDRGLSSRRRSTSGENSSSPAGGGTPTKGSAVTSGWPARRRPGRRPRTGGRGAPTSCSARDSDHPPARPGRELGRQAVVGHEDLALRPSGPGGDEQAVHARRRADVATAVQVEDRAHRVDARGRYQQPGTRRRRRPAARRRARRPGAGSRGARGCQDPLDAAELLDRARAVAHETRRVSRVTEAATLAGTDDGPSGPTERHPQQKLPGCSRVRWRR